MESQIISVESQFPEENKIDQNKLEDKESEQMAFRKNKLDHEKSDQKAFRQNEAFKENIIQEKIDQDEESNAFGQLKSYFENRISLAKIIFIEKSSASISKIVSILIASFLGISALIFLSISLAMYLGELLESPFVGFMIVSGIYLFLVLLLIFLRKSVIEKTLINLQIKKFFSSRL